LQGEIFKSKRDRKGLNWQKITKQSIKCVFWAWKFKCCPLKTEKVNFARIFLKMQFFLTIRQLHAKKRNGMMLSCNLSKVGTNLKQRELA
jgi:hypothetical protein